MTGHVEGAPDFEIGLALAGAISAGAYTAGVLDFLFQALQAWEDAPVGAMPEHTVALRTVAGASAGAITGALGVVALSRGLETQLFTTEELHELEGSTEGPFEPTRCVLPSLYDIWVTRPRMVSENSERLDFLGGEDLQAEVEVVLKSILNAALLDQIKDSALHGSKPRDDGPAYLSKTMHVYMTVSNLRGIPFEVNFGNAKYGMLTHGDRFYFAVSGVGSAAWPKEAWLAQDRCIEVDIATLPRSATEMMPDEWRGYGETALASAAFPGGLAPRLLSTPMNQYDGRQYPLPVEPGRITAKFPDAIRSSEAFTFLNVDGGVVNNTPFDYVQFAIMGFPHAGATSGEKADRAVIMVAPFPEPPAVLPEGSPEPEFSAALRALFPTLINQARFRASELIPVMDDNDHSRFMITPRRTLKEEGPAEFPIACGLLGGFGGFLDEEFRAHDYQLGRRNCQRFLQSTFGLPANNAAIRKPSGRYADHPLEAPGEKASDAPPEYMLVPLVDHLSREVALRQWPRMSGKDFTTLLMRIKGRLELVKGPFIRSQTGKWSVRQIARFGLWAQQDRILRFVALTILADLVRRDQITGWRLPPEIDQAALEAGGKARDVRPILAALCEPARDGSTVTEVARGTHLAPEVVEGILLALSKVPCGSPFRALNVGSGRYTIEVRRPPGWRSWPLIRSVIEAWRPFRYTYP
ncbi:hypothetical protein [Methylobacterium sp. 1030]|uniref:hypothetical protein n=1 Tax=Methylobacterium sp. 1030 TaxID=3156404 RepID=UPI0033945677